MDSASAREGSKEEMPPVDNMNQRHCLERLLASECILQLSFFHCSMKTLDANSSNTCLDTRYPLKHLTDNMKPKTYIVQSDDSLGF
jgi:hypothetical protein